MLFGAFLLTTTELDDMKKVSISHTRKAIEENNCKILAVRYSKMVVQLVRFECFFRIKHNVFLRIIGRNLFKEIISSYKARQHQKITMNAKPVLAT